MTHQPDSNEWTADWPELWRFGACWAGRPVGGVVLPPVERTQIMVQVMEQFICTHPLLPGEMQCRAFLQANAVRVALEMTSKARRESGDPALWHDGAHRSSTPVIDITELQHTDANGHLVSPRWNDLHEQMKPRVLGFFRKQGVPEADAEDLFSESITGLARARGIGTAAIQDLLVFEQVPALFLTIARQRLNNYLRHRHAAKRDVLQTLSLDEHDDVVDKTEQTSFASWAADEADPFSGLTFARLAEECAHGLSVLQQRILSVLYIEESASYMEVATSSWFIHAIGLKSGASDATCRRALDREHDSALEHLAQRLGISRRSGPGMNS